MANSTTGFNIVDSSTPGFYPAPRTALLLLDFHSLFVEKVGGADAVSAAQTATHFRRWALQQGILVIHGLVDTGSSPFPTCKNAAKLESIAALMGEEGGMEPPDLVESVGENEKSFTRRPGFVSALKSPGLLEHLQNHSITSLILAGLSTSGCVMRTAMAATDAEFVVSVLSDACADPGEGVHDFVVGKLLANRAYVFTAAEFQGEFEKVAR